jgi:polysaccharide pyruvyl transferase WcaK-like protein
VSGPPVLVAGWVGSTNLGDELLYRALARQLVQRGAIPTAISTDPAGTFVTHGTGAVGHRDPAAWWRALGDDGRLVFGGGGLLQDESSRLNVPYHLSRVAVGRARRVPIVGVGLGGGRLHRPSLLATRVALAGLPVGARDRSTVRQLTDLGVPARLTADLAFSLPVPTVAPRDEVVISLRPRNVGAGWRPASGTWRDGLPSDAQLTALAGAFGDLARGLGCSLRFVALQADRDGLLHERIADRVRGVDVATVTPTVDQLIAELGRGRLVLGMRFHAAVVALMLGRPVLAAAYSSKVAELAVDAPRTIHRLDVPLSRVSASHAEEALAASDADRAEERAHLVERERGNGILLDDLLAGTVP